MLIKLVGVLDDGRRRDPNLPAYTAQEITIPSGADASVQVQLVYPDGTPMKVTGDYTLTVKQSPFALRVGIGFTKSGTRVGDLVTFTLADTDTIVMPPRRYVYDVWLTDADGARSQLVAVSPFIVLPTITRPA